MERRARSQRSLALTLLLVVWMASADTAAARHTKCHVRESITVESNRLVRLYTFEPFPSRGSRAPKLRSCARRNGRRTALTDDFWFPSVALVGTRVAVAEWETDNVSYDLLAIRIVDWRTGRSLLHTWAGGSISRVGSLVMSRAGGLAWTGCEVQGSFSVSGNPRPECVAPRRSTNFVIKREATTSDSSSGFEGTVLDRGSGVDPRSLRLEGSTLSWVTDGERRFDTLE